MKPGSVMLSTTLARSAPIMQAKPNQCAAPSRPISGTGALYQLRNSRPTARRALGEGGRPAMGSDQPCDECRSFKSAASNDHRGRRRWNVGYGRT